MASSRQLRILEIAGSGTLGTPEMGPVSATICALANGFERRGHVVTVADTKATARRTALSSAVRLITMPFGGQPAVLRLLPGRARSVHGWLSAMAGLWSLRKWIRQGEFDVIHAHEIHHAYLLALFAPGRYHYTSHTSIWALARDQGGALSMDDRIDAVLESFAIRRSRATVGLGDYLCRQTAGAHVETIPHGIEAQRWQPLCRDESRAALGITQDEFVAVFVGRVHPQKGVDVLIEAVRRLAPTMPRLKVIVVGPIGGRHDSRGQPSAYAAEIIRRAHGAPVQFVGFLNNDSLAFRQHLAACDVAVVPSRHEPFGYVALEALAMSAPVIASRTGGLSQTVTDEVGYLVPPNDVAALADAIRAAHDAPGTLLAKRAKCRARLLEHFSREVSVDRHVSLFMKSLQGATLVEPEWEDPSCSVD